MIHFQNNTKTSAAWERLYNRLETDGLLSEETSRKQASRARFLYFRWAAAVVAIVCAFAATIYYISDKTEPSFQELLTVQNIKGAVTLVATLEDGSVIYLKDDTKLDYPFHFEEKTREVYLTGNALFDVTGNRERPFLVETKNMIVEVLGTSFYINDESEKDFELAVQRGTVKVTHKQTGAETLVEAGETVRLLSGNLSVEPTEDRTIFDQYTRKMQFKDELLENILRIVNKESEEIILQTTPDLNDRLLTVTFSGNSPEYIARLICLALDLSYKQENGVLLISDPN